jgi:hypothetical protein
MALSARGQRTEIEKVEQMVREAERNGREVEFTELFEIPEGLEVIHAAWYYNKLKAKREEVYMRYFNYFKSYHEWYSLYKISMPDEATRKLSFQRIKETVEKVSDLQNLYEVDAADSSMRDMVLEQIQIFAKPHFPVWLSIYDLAPYSSRLKALAMKKCIRYARKFDDWEAIYERSIMGSKHQMFAVVKMWEFEKSMKADSEKIKELSIAKQNKYTIAKRMSEESFDSLNHDNLVMNLYLEIDKEKSEEEQVKREKSK